MTALPLLPTSVVGGHGFWETPRWVTRQKLHALTEGARIVRAELGA